MARRRKYYTPEELHAARREQTNASHRRSRAAAHKVGKVYRAHSDNNERRPDPIALAERAARMALFYTTGPTLNQLLFGDPAPGRSAFETMKR